MKRVLCVGHAVQDFVFGVAALPREANKHRAESFVSVGGGPAATAAVAVARLGGAATLACRLGTDPVAAAIRAELEAYGVDCRYLRRFPGCVSSLSAVMVDGAGERMIVNYVDPQLPVAPGWLSEIEFTDYDAVLADVRWPEGSAFALQRARERGLPAVLDADVPLKRGDPLLTHATHIAFSEPGLHDYSGIDDPATALEQAHRATGAWCCVTLGAQGVCYTGTAGIERQPAFEVEVRDTLGAGDVWHGAFALALAEGGDETQAIRAASAAAAIKVQRAGGRAGVPSRQERDNLLGQQ